MNKATLAGGCFWCMEHAFKKEPGILSTRSGYMGGSKPNPTYAEVCSGKTGHFEVIELLFNHKLITFLQILDLFWTNIDPLDALGQFYDRGKQYQTAIFYHDLQQKRWAELSKEHVQDLFEEEIATQILPASSFYPAEEEHQNYCEKRPVEYQRYAQSHEARLRDLWKKRRKLFSFDLAEKLTPLQYSVTQQGGTEPAFNNEYWNLKAEGTYVDRISGVPLFSSENKFDSGTGWPSFTAPIDQEELILREDNTLGMRRTEVLGKQSGAHLGHLFSDGPTGLRYCVNSAALRFVPS
jgi:peptide methionine sulfoxide reductase msrA/msrB